MAKNYNQAVSNRVTNVFSARGQVIPSDVSPNLTPVAVINPNAYPALVSQTEKGNRRGRLYTNTATAVGWLNVVNIPAGKRWKCFTIRGKVASGTLTIDAIGLLESGQSSVVIIEELASGSDSVQFNQQPITVEGGDKIQIYVDSHSVNGNVQVSVWYYEEDMSE